MSHTEMDLILQRSIVLCRINGKIYLEVHLLPVGHASKLLVASQEESRQSRYFCDFREIKVCCIMYVIFN